MGGRTLELLELPVEQQQRQLDEVRQVAEQERVAKAADVQAEAELLKAQEEAEAARLEVVRKQRQLKEAEAARLGMPAGAVSSGRNLEAERAGSRA